MAVLNFYDQVFTDTKFQESALRKVILGTGLTQPEYDSASGINILYSINSTGLQACADVEQKLIGQSSIILGGKDHVLNNSSYSTILGGTGNSIISDNRAGFGLDVGGGDTSAIVGGVDNKIYNGPDSFIIGGTSNQIGSYESYYLTPGNAILNSAKVQITANSQNNTVIQVGSGQINGSNNISLLGHNVTVNGTTNFTVGANLTVNTQNTIVLSDGRRPFKVEKPDSVYIRATNGLIFKDFINIKADNLASTLFGNLQDDDSTWTYLQNRNVRYTDDYGGYAYLNGYGEIVGDITGINLSAGYKALPIIIGERSIGPIFCDWSGVISGVVYRIPSNAINIGYDNSYNMDDVVIGNHNSRRANVDRSLDKRSDPYSRADIVIGSFNEYSGNDSVVIGKTNQISANENTITIGNNNIATAEGVKYSGLFISKEAEAIDELIMIGYMNTEDIGLHSIMLGSLNKGITQEGLFFGKENFLSGVRTSVIGHANKILTSFTFVGGSSNYVTTSQSNVVGRQNTIDYPYTNYIDSGSTISNNSILGNNNSSFGGRESSIIGLDNVFKTQAIGTGIPLRNTVIIGNQNLSSSSQSVVVGHFNNDYSITAPDGNFNTFVFGSLNRIQQTNFSTAIGYGNRIGRITNGFALGNKNSVVGQQAKSNRAGLNPENYANYNLLTGENTLALGFNALAEGSNKIVFGSYTRGLPKVNGEEIYNQGTSIFNQGMYQRAFLNWKGYYSASGTNTIELTLDGIVPTGSVTSSNYHRGRAYMPSGRVWNGFVNVMARKGLGSTESIWSQLRHVTIYRDQGASKPVVVSDTILSTQSGNFAPGNPSDFSVNFSGLNDYVIVTARGNNTSAGYTSGVGINWHVVGDFAETITSYENSKGVLINIQEDTQPEGYKAYQIYAS